MFGWVGKILRVDLSQGRINEEDLPLSLMEDYIGGRGMAIRILFDEIDPSIDALSPENKLIFATGPVTGTGMPAGSRFIVSAKSPLSHCIANPCCGGYFGLNLKCAGYDLLIVEGKSPDPVYISIHNDRVQIRSADHLWGKTSAETEKAIMDEMKGGLDEMDEWARNSLAVVNIGPAGENLVRFACIMADGGRAAGRSGMGIPAWHPQAFDALGIQYATNNVGASHTKSTMPFYEGRKDPARFVEFTKKDQDYVATVDSGVLCWIIYHGPQWSEKLAEFMTIITGKAYTEEELALKGEKIWNLERLFNLKAGLTMQDDSLPPRITKEPRVKGRVVPLEKLLPEYYDWRGWDKNGIPAKEKLQELGLEKEGVEVV